MFHRRNGLAPRVGRDARRLMADERLTGDRVLSVAEPLKVFFTDVAGQSPLGGERPVPLADDPLAFSVVVLANVLELFRVIPPRLSCAQWPGDRQHRRYRKKASPCRASSGVC